MKFPLALIAALLLSTGLAQAAESVKTEAAAPVAKTELSSSQQRMVDCNKEAAGKKGDERKTFMRQCMHGDKAATGGTQQNRMKTCNTEAGDKKGAERKAFMSECLKNK
ncbi:MAG: hypothetical protein B7Y41_07850 [Hydrogenophilales bacterium 28-61-23]|nr:MAG: hypothetical protein B7Y41_07850 [Hydrogenophilales bacterium 28-61-23]